MPIPGNPLAYTLVYALESPRGPVLIDAGWQHEDAWTALTGGLATFGIDVADVHGVVVTHFHPDHAGLAGRVREASGAWVAMHRADADVVRMFHSTDHTERTGIVQDTMKRAGASQTELDGFTGGAGPIDPPALPDRELLDGDMIDLPGRKLRAIHTPGHSPGHICLHLEDADRVFTGDHVLPRITPHIGLYPYDIPDVDPLGDFLGSLARIGEMTVDEVLPAHQYRFADLPARVREIARHHEERLDEITALLSASPTSLWDVTAGLTWRHPWTEMPVDARRMAAGEAAAHLRTLENRGTVRRADANGTLSFTKNS